MRIFYITGFCLLICCTLYGQTSTSSQSNTENIYTIKQQFLYNILHNPTDVEGDDDNELARFNRWFHDVEVRTYPTGNLPRPDVILTATQQEARKRSAMKQTYAPNPWQPVGPMQVPVNNNGIGRVNCIVIDPVDTGTLYIGTACGGVFISHDGGNTWVSNSDNFPSLSIADIAVNPRHTDTIYAATGDGYGYETGSYDVFWGGLYSAGVMMSADGGNSWHTTGLSYLQSDRDIIQRLLINPNKPNILLAASRKGIYRTTDAGATWNFVDSGHVFSMAFKPTNPDTVYAINANDMRISYDAGATWHTLSAGLNPSADRCTIAVSPASPNSVWVLDANDSLQWSHNGGRTFYPVPHSPDTAHFYGYYDRVLAVSPGDSNYILSMGLYMGVTTNGAFSWGSLDTAHKVHSDNHAVAINPRRTSTIYCGNDGGIFVTYDGGNKWKNLSNGLMISQIYRIGTSQQDPYVMICGLQDNGTLVYDGTTWTHKTGGDGEACAISPQNDALQISSWQNGHFYISSDGGSSFTALNVSTENAAWTAPVAFDASNFNNIYFGYKDIFATYDQGANFTNLTVNAPFAYGATVLAVAPSNGNVIYAGDNSKLIRTINGGTTWTAATGNLPLAYVALTGIAVDPRNPMHIYATVSGYLNGFKVYESTTGGTTWTNISNNLPNLPVDCIAIDSSTPGALFVGTDMGVYYTDSSQTDWAPYSTGLPNVIANDLSISYLDYKIRVATYGRGVWECNLRKRPSGVAQIAAPKAGVRLFPNPSKDSWKLFFDNGRPNNFTATVTDVTGRFIGTFQNPATIDASGLASGEYNIDVKVGDTHYTIKAIRN